MQRPAYLVGSLLAVALLAGVGHARADAAAANDPDADWPPSERLLGQFAAGRYDEVLRTAPALLAEEPDNTELRRILADSLLWSGRAWAASCQYRPLLTPDGLPPEPETELHLAHSLAWSGRMAAAVPHYSAQLNGKQAHEARVGLANALHWMGRDELALPHYRQALDEAPDEELTRIGAIHAERALRPTTTLGYSRQDDNSPMHRREMSVAHTWRNDAGNRIYRLETVADRDWNPELSDHQHETSVRVEDLALPFAPRVDVSQQSGPEVRTFGHLRLRVADQPLYLNVGKLNWGKYVFNVRALDAGLSAWRIGLEGKVPTAAGEFRGFVNRFAISDGNHIDNGDIRLTPWLRPLGQEVRPYAGVTWRYSGRADARYWSPETYAALYAGLEGEWVRHDWTFSAFAHVGTRLAGEATSNWAAGLSGKRWVTRDWALGLNGWAQSNGQGTNYSARGYTLSLEKLW